MKKKLHTLFGIVILFLSTYSGYAQKTTTVTYSGSGLDTFLCNVFNTATLPVIKGLTHYPLAGGAKFVGGNAIDLKCQKGMTQATQLGTGYAIGYSFKQGYTYTISVTASKSSRDSISQAYLYLSLFATLPDPNQTNAGACGPVGSNNWGAAQNSSTGVCAGYVSKTSATITGSTFTAASNFSYLSIVASQGSDTVISDVKITSVIIKESLDVNISPNQVSFNCGTALTQTFTASIPSNAAGINSYTWQIDPGWTYNGSPAPASITTTSNSIQLTAPACTSLPGSVSVKANVTGYSSPAAIATVSLLHYNISGPSLLCTSSVYSIADLNCPSATVSWSASPSGILSLTPNGSSVTATPISSGYVNLLANISTPCGTMTAVKSFAVGPPLVGSGYYTDQGIQHTLVQNGISFVCNDAVDAYIPVIYATSATWTTEPGFPTSSGVVIDQYNGLLQINFNGVTSPLPFRFTATSFCDTLVQLYIIQHVPCSGPSMASFGSYTIAPNPAANMVTVTSNTYQSSSEPKLGAKSISITSKIVNPAAIEQIKIFDISGKLKKRLRYSTKISRTEIDVADLIPGIYVIEISNGPDVVHEKLIINR